MPDNGVFSAFYIIQLAKIRLLFFPNESFNSVNFSQLIRITIQTVPVWSSNRGSAFKNKRTAR
jgi:hypothetical protein